MQWGDELCGVPVTPEAWAGGVVELRGTVAADGQWNIVFLAGGRVCYGSFSTGAHIANGCRPIFPPRGWAGKFDFELWEAVWPAMGKPHYEATLFEGDWWRVGLNNSPAITLKCGSIEYGHSSWGCGGCTVQAEAVTDLPALILALQNAQVLADRLRSAE